MRLTMTHSSEIKTEPIIVDDEDEARFKMEKVERFFKILTTDFHTILRLPPAFGKKLKAETPHFAFLISRKGTWPVKIERCKDEQVCFSEGWDKFAEAHNLDIGDFVLFEHQSNMKFKVLVYDSSCCENEFSPDIMEEEKEEKEEEEDSADFGCEYEFPPDTMAEDGGADFGQQSYARANQKIKRGRPRKVFGLSSHEKRQFTTKIASKHYLHIPKTFWKSNKLDCTQKVLLKGPSQEFCKVKVKWYSKETPYLYEGWFEFYESNGLKDGDICTFQLSSQSDPSVSDGSPIKFNVMVTPSPNLN